MYDCGKHLNVEMKIYCICDSLHLNVYVILSFVLQPT